MPFIERDETGAIMAAYNSAQPNRAEEYLDEGHADVVAFRSRPMTDSLTAEDLREMLETKGVLTAADKPKRRLA